jgi:hypothetical protein
VTLENGRKTASRKAKSRRVFGHSPRQAKTPFRVGLYARVSTGDQQTIPLQMRPMREYAPLGRGWRIALARFHAEHKQLARERAFAALLT